MVVRNAIEADRPVNFYVLGLRCSACDWDWDPEAPTAGYTLRGPNSKENAWLLGLGAALLERAHARASPEPMTVLQEILDDPATVLSACDGNTWFRAIAASVDPAVSLSLADYYAQVGIEAEVPELGRGFDQDGDCVPDGEDNCPTLENNQQNDADEDSVGDACECDLSGPDGDGDFWPDSCDNCVDVWNPGQEERDKSDDYNTDDDAWGDACDSCSQSPGVGGVPGENCCDPREENTCTKVWWASLTTFKCGPDMGGGRFTCNTKNDSAGTMYGWPSNECWDWPCVDGWQSKTCTVGNDVECEGVEGATCIPWFADGDAHVGIEDLGICGRADSGDCAGVPARECVEWGPLNQ